APSAAPGRACRQRRVEFRRARRRARSAVAYRRLRSSARRYWGRAGRLGTAIPTAPYARDNCRGCGAVVAEPDRPVRCDNDVVGGGQALALEAASEHRDRAVVFGAGQPLRIHLARDQTALAVAGVAIGIVRGAAKHADRAGFLLPFHDPVVRDVAPQEVAVIAEPHRALGKAAAAGEALDRRVAQDI